MPKNSKTPAEIINETEKSKAVKVLKKQLAIGVASLVAITVAAVIVTKILDADAEENNDI